VSSGHESLGSNWRVMVADNGVGKLTSKDNPTKDDWAPASLNALAHQLPAQVELISNAKGVRVSIRIQIRFAAPSGGLKIAIAPTALSPGVRRSAFVRLHEVPPLHRLRPTRPKVR
jgi:hypothetical protein